MDASTAIGAVNGILLACDPETRKKVVKVLSLNREEKTKKKPVSILHAREDLIRNHFKQ